MPPDWTTLPVHHELQYRPPRDSIAVYTKNEVDKSLIYEGYICPTSPKTLHVSALQPPPRELDFRKKYAMLQEKIKEEETEAEIQSTNISEVERHRKADSAENSKSEESVVKAEPSTVLCCNNTDDKLKQQIIAEPASSNSNYPLPFEILEQREWLLPAPVDREFAYCFEPWESTVDMTILDCLHVKTAPS